MKTCPTCGSAHVRKSGFKTTKTGRHPLFRCVPGRHAFTGREKFHRATDAERVLAMKLEHEGLSVRAIARTVGRFPRAVTCWIEKKATPRGGHTRHSSAR